MNFVQLQEAFPDCAVSKEGSASDHMVVVLLDGCEVWRADTRLVPILAPDTTNQALAAVRAATASCQPTPARKPEASVDEVVVSFTIATDSEPAMWIGELDCWGFG